MDLANPSTLFHTKGGIAFPGVNVASLRAMRQMLFGDYGFSIEQAAEAASFSMAMVVRSALGLTAKDGVVCAIASDNLSGCVAIAALRHIVCAGGAGQVYTIGDPATNSESLNRQLKTISKMGVPIEAWSSVDNALEYAEALGSCHAAILGMFEPEQSLSALDNKIIEVLNESSIPVHTIDCPPDVNPDTGAPGANPVFASSTLSLGAPLIGLNNGSDNVGRHYLCDICFDQEIYKTGGMNLCSLFAEQPVIQIYPVKPEEPEAAGE